MSATDNNWMYSKCYFVIYHISTDWTQARAFKFVWMFVGCSVKCSTEHILCSLDNWLWVVGVSSSYNKLLCIYNVINYIMLLSRSLLPPLLALFWPLYLYEIDVSICSMCAFHFFFSFFTRLHLLSLPMRTSMCSKIQ